jgi:hypothetical protein
MYSIVGMDIHVYKEAEQILKLEPRFGCRCSRYLQTKMIEEGHASLPSMEADTSSFEEDTPGRA